MKIKVIQLNFQKENQGREVEGKHNFQASKETFFLNKKSNTITEAIGNSLAAMPINQAKGISECKYTGMDIVNSLSSRSYTST